MIEFFLRFVVFTIYESPKFLMGKGRDEDAVMVVHEVARRNGKTSNRGCSLFTSMRESD